MFATTITVLPVEGGWAVHTDQGEPTFFLTGGRAEGHARRLGRAAWRAGAPAVVLVHDRGGEPVGAWRFGPGADGALERATAV